MLKMSDLKYAVLALIQIIFFNIYNDTYALYVYMLLYHWLRKKNVTPK